MKTPSLLTTLFIHSSLIDRLERLEPVVIPLFGDALCDILAFCSIPESRCSWLGVLATINRSSEDFTLLGGQFRSSIDECIPVRSDSSKFGLSSVWDPIAQLCQVCHRPDERHLSGEISLGQDPEYGYEAWGGGSGRKLVCVAGNAILYEQVELTI